MDPLYLVLIVMAIAGFVFWWSLKQRSQKDAESISPPQPAPFPKDSEPDYGMAGVPKDEEVDQVPSAPPEEWEETPPPRTSRETEAHEFEHNRGKAGQDDKQHVVVTVYYGTDREPTGSLEPNEYFSGQRGAPSYGTCRVSIPHKHKVGELEAPSIFRLQFREDPDKHVVLLEIRPTDRDHFFGLLRSESAQSEKKQAFIFIHGYNVNFKTAARRTAQIFYDLKFDGAPIFYSWPSKGTPAGYPADEDTIDWSKNYLKNFLKDVAKSGDFELINIIAHSMGNRATTRALIELAEEGHHAPFREIILTAPDIDARIFVRDIAQKLTDSYPRITLYASSRDKALNASKKIHQTPRAGEAGENIVILPDMDTIDASSLDTDFLGHSYYGSSRVVMTDIYNLFVHHAPPDKRFGLSKKAGPQHHYWVFETDE